MCGGTRVNRSEFQLLSRECGSVKVHTIRTISILKMCICTRTAATMYQNVRDKYEGNNPKMPRQTNLRALMYCFALCLQPHECAF